jgi:DNA-binding PadR family transcriptional regulator
MTDLILLTALLGGPAYGYALKRTAGLIFGGNALHNNVVYPLLRKFVQSGWVEQSSIAGDRGQQRKLYRITELGRKYLFEQIAAFGDREACDDGAFLLRVALFDCIPKERREEMIAARRAFLTARTEQFSKLRKTVKPKSFAAIALDRTQAVVEDELQWIERLERKTRRS